MESSSDAAHSYLYKLHIKIIHYIPIKYKVIIPWLSAWWVNQSCIGNKLVEVD